MVSKPFLAIVRHKYGNLPSIGTYSVKQMTFAGASEFEKFKTRPCCLPIPDFFCRADSFPCNLAVLAGMP
jgi:hypothetical protein